MAALRRSPRALFPFLLEGVVGGALVSMGAWPGGGASAASTAAFPLDVFFDVKQSLAVSSSWIWFLLALVLSVGARSALLAGAMWLSEGAPGSFVSAWGRCCKLAATAAAIFIPSAAFLFAGVAIRYAPFIWVGGLAGLAPAVWLVRRSLQIDVGGGVPRGGGVPEVAGFLAYAYSLGVIAAVMSVLGDVSRPLAGLCLVFLGPVHACMFLGWREHLREETFPGGGALAVAATFGIVVTLTATSLYDRHVRDAPPVGEVHSGGTLLVLGGVDSTSETGALSSLDPRDLGFARDRLVYLSYVGSDRPFVAEDTRRDLSKVAVVVSEQVRRTEPPARLLGHSQASHILDRMVVQDLTTPAESVILAGPPASRPPVEVPPPDEVARGKTGGDATRILAELLGLVGLEPFDVDAPAAPPNLDVAPQAAGRVARLNVWAWGDSVWLAEDWRRPGELNIVALTDHVGVTNNGRALGVARSFYRGRLREDDRASWRGLMVGVLRYAFEPWRPQ